MKTDQGIVAFKNAKKMKDIDFIDSVIQHLHLHEFSYVPTLRKTKNNNLLLHHQHGDYVVEQWLPSDVREVSPYKRDWLHAAGKKLAQFHEAAATYPVYQIPKKRIRKAWGEWFFRKYEKVKEWSRWRNSHTDSWLLARMKQVKDNHLKYPNITSSLCHGSLHQENIMMDANSEIWFIDFERLTYDSIGKDLAQILMYHFRFHPWNREDVDQLLAGYQSVSVLSQSDLIHFCARNLVSERMIYAYLDGKPILEDQEQERAKESVLREIVPAYWY
nr:phosphotransferase [Shimazuella soli]